MLRREIRVNFIIGRGQWQKDMREIEVVREGEVMITTTEWNSRVIIINVEMRREIKTLEFVSSCKRC